MKTVEHYMQLPYTIVMRRDEDGDIVVRIAELAGCSAHGSTPEEALDYLGEVQRLWITESLNARQAIPEPEPEEELPSGKWVQRVPRTLHRKLTQLAKRENVSLNHLVTTMLSECVAHKIWNSGLEDLRAQWANQIDCSDPWERGVPGPFWTIVDVAQKSRASSAYEMLAHVHQLFRGKMKVMPSDAHKEEEQAAHSW